MNYINNEQISTYLLLFIIYNLLFNYLLFIIITNNLYFIIEFFSIII